MAADGFAEGDAEFEPGAQAVLVDEVCGDDGVGRLGDVGGVELA